MYISDHECIEEGHRPHPLRKHFVGRIRQTDLARQIGVSTQQLNQFFLGKRRLQPVFEHRLMEVARQLGVEAGHDE
jgi:plasmid maintenance system antidote protein VapI